MSKIQIINNHFRSSPDNLGTYNNAPITMQEPGIDWQNNEFNITPPAKLKVPEYVRGEVEDIGDRLRFHWKDSVTGGKSNPFGYTINLYINDELYLYEPDFIKPSIKKRWELSYFDFNTEVSKPGEKKLSIKVFNRNPAYQFKYGFHICLANLHYRNVLTDFADQSFGAWKVTQSPVNEGYDPAQYGIKQFDTYGAQPYSLWIEWPIGKKYEAGAWVEVATEI